VGRSHPTPPHRWDKRKCRTLAGTRVDLKVPDGPDGGWINAATEAEWEKRLGP
jgi:hypothetical protein